MKMMRSWVAEYVLAAVIAVTACGGGSDSGQGSGVVRGIDTENAQITLEHGDIPGLMKAMTMTFDVADRKLLEGVEVGDEVNFRLRDADGKYAVIEIDPR